MPIDLISVPIKQSLEELSAITGENVSEDIIAEIFSKFCLGK
jgi:tRNA modification GTPase